MRCAANPRDTGRSVRSCQSAYQALLSSAPHVSHGNPRVDPSSTRTRYSAGGDQPASASRALQPRPRPFSLNGEQGVLFPGSPGDEPGQPPKKKRGRPSRADIEARDAANAANAAAAAAAAARAVPYHSAQSPQMPQMAKMVGRQSIGGEEDQRDYSSGIAPGVVMPTSAGPAGGPGSPATIGKKRRGRPTKAESDAKRLLLEGAAAAAGGVAPAEQPQEKIEGPAEEPAEGPTEGPNEDDTNMAGHEEGLEHVAGEAEGGGDETAAQLSSMMDAHSSGTI